ncbi:hypothetical protein KUTeg_022812 [Tegillarca granosa]|uniref:ATP synthase F0 subunit 8 n=1 Tax=Tegillarca granosa TaxID=220873 RepID=A0ABQ9E5D5_TEGGR|nr:hypothetical protein KUTeg_022812 [Tegillarca granosa]
MHYFYFFFISQLSSIILFDSIVKYSINKIKICFLYEVKSIERRKQLQIIFLLTNVFKLMSVVKQIFANQTLTSLSVFIVWYFGFKIENEKGYFLFQNTVNKRSTD